MNPTMKPCEGCGESFEAQGNQRFCTRCSMRTCPACGKEFIAVAKAIRRGTNLFCSQACYHVHRFGKRERCAICGKETGGRKFCSSECRLASMRDRDQKRGPVHREQQRLRGWEVKKEFMRSLGGRCVDCGIDDLRVLEFHHKDRTIKDPLVRHFTNPSFQSRVRLLEAERENLELLCANCHRLHTHAEVWRTDGIF